MKAMEDPTDHNDAEARRERLASFAALCAWIIGSATMAAIAYSWYGQDFRGYYAAARVLLNGGNPYDYSQVVAVRVKLPVEQATTHSIIHSGLAGSLHHWHGCLFSLPARSG